MYLIYDTVTKIGELKEQYINFPMEKLADENLSDYKLNIGKSIKENLIPSGFKEIEILELIDVLNQIEVNQLGQNDIPEMLERASTKKLRESAKLFRTNIRQGKTTTETLKELKLPRYIIMSLESAQKGGKLGDTYNNIMSIIQLRLDTSRKIAKILRYPKIVVGFLLAYYFAIMFYIIPQSHQLIAMIDEDKIPELSKTLYSISAYGEEDKFFFIAASIIGTFLIYKGLYFLFAKIVTFIPAIRRINEYKDTSLFFSILASLQESGVMLHNSIKFASEIITVQKTREMYFNIGRVMQKEGGTFYEQIKDQKELEDQVKTFIYYGEKTGRQNVYFKNIKNMYSTKMNDQIDIALEFINPITMIFTVAIMLTLYIGVNAPLLNFGDL